MGPKEKRERALGERLGLKGDRSMSPKSAFLRKPYRPGVHGPQRGRRPRTLSEFGLQIREKRKFKLAYGVGERGMKRLYLAAVASKGASSEKLLQLLESRLDNAVYRLGFAPTRLAARQLVRHGHISVNKRKTSSPGYLLKKGDTVSVREGSEGKQAIAKRRELLKKYDAPPWLALAPDKLEGIVLSPPSLPEIPFDVKLLIESFSK